MRRPRRDPQVTDLRRYRRERERARRKPAPRATGPNQSFLGSRPRAGLILALVILAAAGLWLISHLR